MEINCSIINGKLNINCSYSENLHKKETVKGLINNYVVEMRNIIKHCLQTESGVYTPSDFPLCDISQNDLDEIIIVNEDERLIDYNDEVEI